MPDHVRLHLNAAMVRIVCYPKSRGMVAAVGTARQSCGKAGKSPIFKLIRDSSGEFRLNLFGIWRKNHETRAVVDCYHMSAIPKYRYQRRENRVAGLLQS